MTSKRPTKKKLEQLFRAPTDTEAGSFQPRNLDRPPQEFDGDGRKITGSTQKTTQEHATEPENTTRQSKAYATQEPSRPSIPPSAASQRHPTAPWAANAAFESWKKQRHATPSTSDGALPPASTANARNDAPRASVTTTNHRTTVGKNKRNALTGMQARTSFDAWKSTRPHVEQADSTSYESPPALVENPHDRDAIKIEDRTRRLAAQHYTHKSATSSPHQNAETPHAETSHAKTRGTHDDTAHSAQWAQPAYTKSRMPRLDDAAERLMWLRAHQAELETPHLVESLRMLADAPLREGHEVIRLRMLAEGLMALQQGEESRIVLRRLLDHLPHDAWTMLRLAQECAADIHGADEALSLCTEIRRLHPWLAREVDDLIQKIGHH